MCIINILFAALLQLCFVSAVFAHRDIILELKGAAFLSTSSHFRDIYHKAGGLGEVEVTFRLPCYTHWYGFASVGYTSENGRSIGFCSPTKVKLVPLAFGLKYVAPVCWGDVYAGLGFQPVHVRTVNCSPYVAACTSQWGFGGVTKLGTFIDLPCNFLLDLFFDYSFVKTGCKKIRCKHTTGPVVPLKANASGAILGIGLGYRF